MWVTNQWRQTLLFVSIFLFVTVVAVGGGATQAADQSATTEVSEANITIEINDSSGSSDSIDVPITIQSTDSGSNYTVNDLQPQEATVNVSDEFNVSARIENVGNEAGEQDIELRLEPDGDAVLNQTLNLESGATDTVTFEDVSVDELGTYNHTIATTTDSATGSLTVEKSAENGEPDRPDTLPSGVSTGSFNAIDSNDDGELSPSEIALAINANANQGSVDDVEVSPSEFALMINWNATN